MLPNIKFYAMACLALFGDKGRADHNNEERQQIKPADLLPTVLSHYMFLSTYAECVNKYPGIFEHINEYPGVTILAPSNKAFEKHLDFDIEDKAAVTNLLQYHILQGKIFFNDFSPTPRAFGTLLFNSSYTNVTGGQCITAVRHLDDEIVVESGIDTRGLVTDEMHDIQFFEGLIHPIDTLLVPPLSLAETAYDRFQPMVAFLGALYRTGLDEKILGGSDVTLFVPTNEAFQQAVAPLSKLSDDDLRNLILYHCVLGEVIYADKLINGSKHDSGAVDSTGNSTKPLKLTVHRIANEIFADASQVIDPDILIANGVVHLISNVLNPSNSSQPLPGKKVQDPPFHVDDRTTTGSRVPTPFLTNLPCTTDCPTATVEQTMSMSRHSMTFHNEVAPTGQGSLFGVLVGAGAVVAGAL